MPSMYFIVHLKYIQCMCNFNVFHCAISMYFIVHNEIHSMQFFLKLHWMYFIVQFQCISLCPSMYFIVHLTWTSPTPASRYYFFLLKVHHNHMYFRVFCCVSRVHSTDFHIWHRISRLFVTWVLHSCMQSTTWSYLICVLHSRMLDRRHSVTDLLLHCSRFSPTLFHTGYHTFIHDMVSHIHTWHACYAHSYWIEHIL